jgi:hypothetical protein
MKPRRFMMINFPHYILVFELSFFLVLMRDPHTQVLTLTAKKYQVSTREVSSFHKGSIKFLQGKYQVSTREVSSFYKGSIKFLQGKYQVSTRMYQVSTRKVSSFHKDVSSFHKERIKFPQGTY